MKIELLCGLDEAGRGPLAGPVTAGAVILPKDFPIELLNDSKKLSEKKREKAFEIIKEKALWGVGIVDHTTIDQMNILNASLYCMKLAWEDLLKKSGTWLENQQISDFEYSLIADGNKLPPIAGFSVRAEVKADARFECVMAASIIAKVTRDRIMLEMDKKYPEYGYAKHKGYPTRDHMEICRKIGPSPIQRLSFNYK